MTTAELISAWPTGALKMHRSALQQAVVAAGLSEPQAAAAGFVDRKAAVLLVTGNAVILATEKRFASGSIEVRSIARGDVESITPGLKRRFSRRSLTVTARAGSLTLEQIDEPSLRRVIELLG